MKRTVLIVDDDELVRRALRRTVVSLEHRVLEAGTVEEAHALLLKERIEVIILDIRLGERSGVDVARLAWQLEPAPEIIVLTGEAQVDEAFELGQLGVRTLLQKPVPAEQLETLLKGPRAGAPQLEPMIKRAVGHKTVASVVSLVRNTMFEEALAKTGGNGSRAARLLGVSRQAVSKRAAAREAEEG